MDKLDEQLLDSIAEKAATEAVAKMREFHQADLQVLGERMDIGFEKIDREMAEIKSDIVGIKTDIVGIKSDIAEIKGQIVVINSRLDRIEDAFAMFLKEYRADRERFQQLETQVAELMRRVAILESQLATR